MHFTSWLVWAAILFAQNISFTYVSRARSSGSIFRHLKASIFSNGIWIFSQIIMLGLMFDNLTGKHGLATQLTAAAVYTVSCVSGSLFAHWLAMKTEKGKNAVGYNKKYAQIPVEEYAAVQARLKQLKQDIENLTAAVAGQLETIQDTQATISALPTKEEFERVKDIALQANDIVVGIIPDAGIKAHKVGNQTVVTGMPNS